MTPCTYDHRRRLIDVTTAKAAGDTLSSAQYTYDALDRRIAKNVDGDTTHFVYDGRNIWADFDDAGNVLTRYMTGTELEEALAYFVQLVR